MKKLYILAALLMATTSAHAGGITFQINGERVRVEAPRNCSGISCIKITSPGYTGTLGNIDLKGMGSKSKNDDDVVAAPAPPRSTRSGPGHRAAAPRSRRDCGDARARSNNRCGTNRSCAARSASAARADRRRACTRAATGSGRPSRRVRPELADRHLGDGREQGQRSHRGMRRQSVRLFRQHRRKDSDQHEAAGQQVDRPDS